MIHDTPINCNYHYKVKLFEINELHCKETSVNVVIWIMVWDIHSELFLYLVCE